MQSKQHVYKVKKIIIHQLYVRNRRDQNDIALVKTKRPFDFSIKEKVSPICLPDFQTIDTGVEVAAAGWGYLFEQNYEKGKSRCLTMAGGPEVYQECRDWFLYRGLLYDTSRSCVTNTEPPSHHLCQRLHSLRPETRNIFTNIKMDESEPIQCFPSHVEGSNGWCAVCNREALPGQPGHCDLNSNLPIEDVDYGAFTPDDISFEAGWGFCDEKCHVSLLDLGATVLQEVKLFSLAEKQALIKTNYLKKENKSLSLRPQVKYELGVAKKKESFIDDFLYINDSFVRAKSRNFVIWGGSDTCQGDSGGPLYKFETSKKKAVLVGVVNRGQGCARQHALGIYARVKYHMGWIRRNVDAGGC